MIRRVGVWISFIPMFLGLVLSCRVKADCSQSDPSCSMLGFLFFGRTLAPRFAYVSNNSSSSISVYSVNPFTGMLTLISNATTSVAPMNMALDQNNKYLYVTSLGAGLLSMYTLDPNTGAFSNPNGTVTATNSIGIAADYASRFAYAVENSPDNVFMYTMNSSNGLLSSNGTIPTGGTTARSIVIDPAGKFAFVSHQAGVSNVFAFTINQSTGTLVANGSFTAGSNVNFSAIEPGGRFLYSPAFGSNSIFMLTVDQVTGAISNPLGSISTLPQTQPYVPAVDPFGKFLFVINQNVNTVSSYSIQSNGSLVLNGTVATGSTPSGVRVDPTGKFVYVVNNAANSVSMYRIETTGLLTTLGTVPCGGNAQDIVVTGGYVF